MSGKLKFIWLDDTYQREESAKVMGARLSADVEFISLNRKDIDDELNNLRNRDEPDLILMDHSLESADIRTVRNGASAATILREHWHNCPIVSVTGVGNEEMDSFQRSAYDAIFDFNKISQSYSTILAIANGFRALKSNYPKNVEDILDFLDVPQDDRNKMKKILPVEIKDNLQDKSLLLEIYRWYRSVLQKRPGFLYDRIWVCTLLGLNNLGFKQVEEKFAKAKYNGVFEDKLNERWWKSKVLSTLGNEVDKVGLPWVIGRSLVENNKKFFSRCYASEEDFPETVAAEDETLSSGWYPMKLKYTEPHPLFEDMLFFEELRIMKPAE